MPEPLETLERLTVDDPPTAIMATDVMLAMLKRNLELLHKTPVQCVKHRASLRRTINNLESELFRRLHHEPSKDWTEDFCHENGDYQNSCCVCHDVFRGHKRRVVCRLCAVPEKSLEKMAECH